MIQFGTSLQGKEDKLPKEIADWLRERNAAYPEIEFELERLDVLRPEDREFAAKYSRSFTSRNYEMHGVRDVMFWYGSERWYVRTIGAADKTGKILSGEEKYTISPFDTWPIPRETANAIVGFDPSAGYIEQKFGEATTFWLPRREGEIVPERAGEYVEFHPEARYTSELEMTGAELNTLMSDPKTKKELLEATDWEQVREIKKRNEN